MLVMFENTSRVCVLDQLCIHTYHPSTIPYHSSIQLNLNKSPK